MAQESLSAKYLDLLNKWIAAQDLYLTQAAQAPTTNLPPTVTAPNGQKVDYNKFYEVCAAQIKCYDKLYRDACTKEGADSPRMIYTQLTPTKRRLRW